MGGHPIGRQPFRPGQWSRYQGGGSINIYHKEVHNNYGGAMFPMMNYGMYGNYGYYNPGLTSGEKWMLALGGIGAIGGAILSGLTGGTQEVEAQPEQRTQQEQPQNLTKEDVAEIVQQEVQKQLASRQKAHQAEVDAVAAAKEQAKQYDPGARKVDTQQTTTYTIKATKNADGTVTGDTGYNIIAGKYKSADGTPLTNSEIKAIADKIFGGKALKVGDIELPNEIEVNGKTYEINPEGEVKPTTYGLAKHEIYQSGAKQVGSYWIGTLNGEDISDTQYATEAEAKAAAEEAAKQQTQE